MGTLRLVQFKPYGRTRFYTIHVEPMVYSVCLILGFIIGQSIS